MIPIPSVPGRRHVLSGIAFAVGGLAVNSRLQGQEPAKLPPPVVSMPTVQQASSQEANKARTTLHQEIDLNAPPARVFEILIDGKQFAAFTGMPADIDPKPGGAFKTFGGLIEGRNVELIPAQRVIQAWRPSAWPSGVYSLVHHELAAAGSGTRLVLDHTGFPEGDYDHLYSGWGERYWDPLKKYLR